MKLTARQKYLRRLMKHYYNEWDASDAAASRDPDECERMIRRMERLLKASRIAADSWNMFQQMREPPERIGSDNYSPNVCIFEGCGGGHRVIRSSRGLS